MAEAANGVPHARPEYPPELASVEDVLIRARRDAVRELAGSPASPVPSNELSSKVDALEGRVGVGLSGGGIRSATFCLGVYQALAKTRENAKKAASPLLARVDYLSTVSGGGFFGCFLGRLFSRPWVSGPEDVARVLGGNDEPKEGPRAFRFLRDNGRYLAPRGSGDLLMLIAIGLRNWAAVQVVIFAFVLTLFVGLQLAGLWMPSSFLFQANVYVSALAGGGVAIWWSWWFLALVPVVVLWAIPTCWGYWVIGQPVFQPARWIVRRSDLLVLAICGVVYYAGWLPPEAKPALAIIAVSAAATVAWSTIANWRAILHLFAGGAAGQANVDNMNQARNRVSTWFKSALVASVVIAAAALIDSLGATVHVMVVNGRLFGWIVGLVTTFAGAAAFGRQLLVLLGKRSSTTHLGVKWSVASWIIAAVVAGAWLIGVNATSHAVAWRFSAPSGYPASILSTPATKLRDADAIVIDQDADGRQTIRAAEDQVAAAQGPEQTLAERRWFTFVAFVFLAILTLVLGNSSTFLNQSTLHGFYAQRLTRAYLGATNDARLNAPNSHVTTVFDGDDVPSSEYWNWPRIVEDPSRMKAARKTVTTWLRSFSNAPEKPGANPVPLIIRKGGPLHLVNVTVNETLDARTGVQQQDRKGVALAIGPAGFSLGVRHHLVADGKNPAVAPGDGFKVFDQFDSIPEELTLGRWSSISGAAFATASGSSTSVPMAIIGTFANVRLGYWWNSGLSRDGLNRLVPPVYRGLIAECAAQLRGTSDRLWNVSDGGHFENLAGYELIRRHLPLIVLVDAEADPDYTFEGLSNLVRKARLDFGAEIEFLTEAEANTVTGRDAGIFGSLDMLRRGRWSDEPVPDPSGVPTRRVSVATDRALYSRAHAAIAIVTYADGAAPSWLVYVKASLSGDEPADVIQYHGAHLDFPQETTADQFFDEAQWESYRRLGEHVGESVLTPAIFGLATKPAVVPRPSAPVRAAATFSS